MAAVPGYAAMPSAPYAAAPMAQAPLAAAPMAAGVAQGAAAPFAAPAAPVAAPAARAMPADDFGPLPGAAPAGSLKVASTPRRLMRRPSPAIYALCGFLLAVSVGVAAIIAMNGQPKENHDPVVQNTPEKTHELKTDPKTREISRPATKTSIVTAPEKTDDMPGKTEPPAKTEVMPEKTSTKTSKEPITKTEPTTKEPTTKEPTTKEPMPAKEKPKDQPKSDPQREAYVTAALMSARYHLGNRDLDKAKELIEAGTKQATGARQEEEAKRVGLLAHYTAEFWDAVKEHCKGLQNGGGGAVTIQGITIGFVELKEDYVMFRRAGQNERHYFFKEGGERMKTGLAVGLAELYLAKNDATTHLILGTFKTVNPTSDRAEAREHFDAAGRLGGDEVKETIRLLRPELDVSIPKEAPKVPPAPGMPDQPSDGGKPKPPSGDALVKAQEAMRAKYKRELAAAVFEADKAALAEKLHVETETAEGLDDVGRYVLLLEARDLAAAGRRPKLGLVIVSAIDQQFAIDAWAMRIDVLAAAQKAADDDAAANKELAELALAMADEAGLVEKYAEALRAAIIAVQAARKTKDAELIKQATAREKEVRALKPR
jgi:hypothetical protein